MDIKKVGSRGTLFTFYDLGIPTNVYVINAKKHVYILDTYLGPEVMKPINDYIKEKFGDKTLIVVNSHSHWDHVWGNSLYTDSLIISHVLCREHMEVYGQKQLENNSRYKKGEIVLTYPTLTFSKEICFEEDSILMYYSPGHTEDEISILDLKDKVLFAGDNLERPIPYIMWKNLNQYVKTLEDYLKLDVQVVFGGHTGCEDKGIIRDNLDYIKKVLSGDAGEYETGEYADYHNTNTAWLKSE